MVTLTPILSVLISTIYLYEATASFLICNQFCHAWNTLSLSISLCQWFIDNQKSSQFYFLLFENPWRFCSLQIMCFLHTSMQMHCIDFEFSIRRRELMNKIAQFFLKLWFAFLVWTNKKLNTFPLSNLLSLFLLKSRWLSFFNISALSLFLCVCLL